VVDFSDCGFGILFWSSIRGSITDKLSRTLGTN
jgi:hypothetical protein